jgi:hypothetical protein
MNIYSSYNVSNISEHVTCIQLTQLVRHWGRGGGDRGVPLWSEGKEIPAVEEEED